MFLPIGYKLDSFTITAQIEKTKEHCLYEVASEFNKSFFAAEFFPEDICKRDEETGYLLPSPENEGEYKNRLKSFSDRLNLVKAPGNTQLIKVYRTIREDRDNCICLYHMPESRSLKDYLISDGGKRGYKQAYEMLLPMTEALTRLSRYNIYFKINADNLYVNAFGSVEHAGFMAVDYNENFVAEDISAVLYYLITGKSYVETLAKPSEAGALLPRTLDNLLFENLSYNVRYENLSEFLTKIKDSILFDADMASASDGVINNGRKLPGLSEEAPTPEYAPNIPPMPAYVPSAPQVPVFEYEHGESQVEETSPAIGSIPPSFGYVPSKEVPAPEYALNIEPMPEYIPTPVPAPEYVQNQPSIPVYAPVSEHTSSSVPPVSGDIPTQPVYSTYGSPATFAPSTSSGDGTMYSSQQPYNTYTPPPKPAKSKNGFVIGCALGCLGMFIIMFIILMVAVNAFRGAVSSIGSSGFSMNEPFVEVTEAPRWAEDVYPVFDPYNMPIYYVSDTHFENDKVSIEGTACIYNKHVYYRSYIEGMGWALVESPLSDLESKNILFHTMPAYIVAHNDYLYYCDVYDDYSIYSMYIGEDRNYEALRLNDERSMGLQADDKYVYFINLMDRQYVYTIDLETHESELLISRNVHWLADYGDKLIYSSDEGLLAFNKGSGRNKKLNDSDYLHMRNSTVEDGGYIYYLDIFNDYVKRVEIDGQNESEEICHVGISNIDVDGGFLYYINDVDYTLSRMNLETMETEDLGADPEIFSVSQGYILYLDYYDDSLYILNTKSGVKTALYDGKPDYNEGF